MISLVAALALAAAPRAHPAAHLSVYVPRLDKMGEVTAFMKVAGQRSALLRPDSWRSEFHPLLYLDVTSPAALAEAGLDPAGSATVSYVGDARVSCTTLKNPKRFVERVSQKLALIGEPWKSSAEGVPLVGASTGGRMVTGYALKGNEACAVQGQGSSVQSILAEMAKVVLKPSVGPEWKRASGLPGAAFVVTRYGATGLKGTEQSLSAEGKTAQLAVPKLEPAGMSPYAGLRPSGLAFMRARVAPEGRAAMGRTLLAQLLDVCPACDPAELRKLSEVLLPRLTGAVLLRVDSVKVRDTLRTPSARYFAARHAWVAQVTEPDQVKASLAPIESWKGGRKTGEGYALKATGGEVLLGVRAGHLFVGNDPAAVTAALAGIEGKPGRLAHGADFVVDPVLVAKGLAQIPLFDVLGSQDLAALFAAGTELGPLLAASERIAGWADSTAEGAHRFQATWTLQPPKPSGSAPDAGVP